MAMMDLNTCILLDYQLIEPQALFILKNKCHKSQYLTLYSHAYICDELISFVGLTDLTWRLMLLTKFIDVV